MLNERAYLTQVEGASPEQFAEMLSTADREQQSALRAYFGESRLERLRILAQRQVVRGTAAKRGNLVLVPGIMGSELSFEGSQNDKVWFNFWSIVKGRFGDLEVDSAGKSVSPIKPTGMLRRYYGELEQYLLAEWNVVVAPFDWRLDIRDSADVLADTIKAQFSSCNGVHLVAHSMGGLVARSMAQRHPELWASMGKLVMLGTPNYGSLTTAQFYAGLDRMIRVIAAVDMQHNVLDLLQTAKTFVGTYQMLPCTEKLIGTNNPANLYQPSMYGDLQPARERFEDARCFQSELDTILNPERMTYLAGSNRPTADGVKEWSRLASMDGYTFTLMGDGTVPHSLGLLAGIAATYYFEEEHSQLPSNQIVMATVGNVLAGRQVVGVATEPPSTSRGATNERLASVKSTEDDNAVAQTIAIRARLLAMRGSYDSSAMAPEEQQIADFAIAGKSTQEAAVMGIDSNGSTASFEAQTGVVDPSGKAGEPVEIVATLKVHISVCNIEDIGTSRRPQDADQGQSIDAIAVGHYIGVQPVFAELALDEAITGGLDSDSESAVNPATATENELSDYRDRLLLTQFTQRGIVRGELGRPFFLPDPRDAARLVVIAGMGPVGRFGSPELTVLARELFWSLGRLKKKHLATILIGSGSGNLEPPVAVLAWLRGASLAILSSPDQPHLEELTVVDRQAAKAEEIRLTILGYTERFLAYGLKLDVYPRTPIPAPPASTITIATRAPYSKSQRQTATRVLVELDRNVYRFSAVSFDASFPERLVRIDPKLIGRVNDSLAAQQSSEQKAEWGEFLLKLLVPQDIQPTLSTDAPIVLACDSNVAQIHWELMVSSGTAARSIGLDTAFLGLFPGITRQLRNTFAGPPEPPPPSTRVLRILIVADTDYARPLPGAAAEAARVRDLFSTYATNLKQAGSKMRVEVESLIGPNDATCAQVLKRMLKYPPYDILHYSGHCEYVKEDPPSSGWLFGDGLRLSANELSRVDRVPAFVFSNACESGVTPSRPDLRTPQLAPSFAEAFFERGVKNFVCTAWPVADDSATKFACTFYETLLGAKTGRPAYMHEAMTTARKEIWQDGTGVQTWGAYQHYGNPWFKLF